jgi:hypothetical protein
MTNFQSIVFGIDLAARQICAGGAELERPEADEKA